MSRAGAAEAGFTLLELLVVLAIIAVLATALGGRVVGGLGRSGIQAEARELVEALRRTRDEARARADGTALPLTATGWGATTLDPATRLDAGQDPDGEPVAQVRFFPDGSADRAAILLTRGGAGWRVSVEPITGAVAMEPALAPR